MLVCLAAALSFIKSDLQYASAFCKMSLAALGHREVLWLRRLSQLVLSFPCIVLLVMIETVCAEMNRVNAEFRSLEYFLFQLLMFSI